MTRQAFEQLVRDALAARDKTRKARLFDADLMAAADSAFLTVVLEGAGYPAPPEVAAVAEKTAAKARRSRKKNEDAAFPEAG